MKTQIFNSFAGAYSTANTVITQSLNKGLTQAGAETAAIVAILPEIASLPLDSFGKNVMALFGDKECIVGKTYFDSMVIHSALAVTESVLQSKGKELTEHALMIASSVEVVRKEKVEHRIQQVKEAIKGKTIEEMAEMAANDEGGCAGGACTI